MWWLWIAGPIAVAFIYAVTWRVDPRRASEAEKFRVAARAKRVRSAPTDLAIMFHEAGGGAPVGIFEIVPRLAYVGVFAADVTSGSNHQTVACKLDLPAPSFTLRPLPIVDGARAANTGIPFPKDPELTATFLVEGSAPAPIRKWLKRSSRDALLERPEAWLRVSGRSMALTFYGEADADLLDELLATADAIFAEHGAEGAPALLLDDDDAPPKVRGSSDDDEGGAEEEAPIVVKSASSKKPVVKSEAKPLAKSEAKSEAKSQAATASPKKTSAKG